MHYKMIKRRAVKHYWYDVILFDQRLKFEAPSYSAARDMAMTHIMKHFSITKHKG